MLSVQRLNLDFLIALVRLRGSKQKNRKIGTNWEVSIRAHKATEFLIDTYIDSESKVLFFF